MKTLYFIASILFTTGILSQQQLSNYFENNDNSQIQLAQNHNLTNNLNDGNSFNQTIRQVNFMNDVEDNIQLAQSNISKSDNGNSFNLSFNALARSTSSSHSSSNFKSHKHIFNKKIHKFNRNFYGKMSGHKKSKHLVDVCFNWS